MGVDVSWHVEVRGQLSRVSRLLLPIYETQGFKSSDLYSMHIRPLGHLARPVFFMIVKKCYKDKEIVFEALSIH